MTHRLSPRPAAIDPRHVPRARSLSNDTIGTLMMVGLVWAATIILFWPG